jgi:hypothetical protein
MRKACKIRKYHKEDSWSLDQDLNLELPNIDLTVMYAQIQFS